MCAPVAVAPASLYCGAQLFRLFAGLFCRILFSTFVLLVFEGFALV